MYFYFPSFTWYFPSFTRISLHLLEFSFIYSNLPSFTVLSFIYCIFFDLYNYCCLVMLAPCLHAFIFSFFLLHYMVVGWEGGLVHGDATQLQQQGLAELHLHGSVQTGEALGDVPYDDGGGVLCPHQPQSPPCTAQSSDLLNTASLLLGRKTDQKRTLQRYSPE